MIRLRTGKEGRVGMAGKDRQGDRRREEEGPCDFGLM